LIRASLASPELIRMDGVALLSYFATGATPETAYGNMLKEWEIDRSEFIRTVEKMVSSGYLIPINPTERFEALKAAESLLIKSHVRLLNDESRMLSYKTVIEHLVKGRTVLEIGCGTGILSVLAAKAGAKRVIAIEETGIARIAAELFKANGCSAVELVIGNSRDVRIDERVDIILHELIGFDPLSENVLLTISDARKRFLKSDGFLVPHRLKVCCLGIEFSSDATNSCSEEQRIVALSSSCGINLHPIIAAMKQSNIYTHKMLFTTAGYQILSDELTLFDFDLYENAENWQVHKVLPLSIRQSGELNGLVLYFRMFLNDHELTNSPLAAKTSWEQDYRVVPRATIVQKGAAISIEASVETVVGKQRVLVRRVEQ